jgi:hypothetical protein
VEEEEMTKGARFAGRRIYDTGAVLAADGGRTFP